MYSIGEKVKELRLQQGLTQEELALKCGYKSRSSINKIEKERDMPMRRAYELAKALNVDPAELLGWNDDGTEDIDDGTFDKFLVDLVKLNLTKEQEAQVLDYARFLVSKK